MLGLLFLLAIFAVSLSEGCNGGCHGCACAGSCLSASCWGVAPNCYCAADPANVDPHDRAIHDLVNMICITTQKVPKPIILSVLNRENTGFLIQCHNGTLGGYIVA